MSTRPRPWIWQRYFADAKGILFDDGQFGVAPAGHLGVKAWSQRVSPQSLLSEISFDFAHAVVFDANSLQTSVLTVMQEASTFGVAA